MVVGGWLYDQITTCRLKKTGRNPADRGKQGVKRSLMTDANGLPLWQVVAGANTHDIKLVEYTLDALLNRPGFPGECFICELRLPDHRFRWKHNKLFLLLPEEYGPAFPAIVDCYTSPPT